MDINDIPFDIASMKDTSIESSNNSKVFEGYVKRKCQFSNYENNFKFLIHSIIYFNPINNTFWLSIKNLRK